MKMEIADKILLIAGIYCIFDWIFIASFTNGSFVLGIFLIYIAFKKPKGQINVKVIDYQNTTSQYIKKIFKTIAIILMIIIIGVICVMCYMNSVEEKKQEQKERIIITAEYNLSKCGKEFPIIVTILNNSDRIVDKVYYDIAIYRKGYSNNISYSSYEYSKQLNYGSDKILLPRTEYYQCEKYFVNEDYEKYSPSELSFEITNRRIIFQE